MRQTNQKKIMNPHVVLTTICTLLLLEGCMCIPIEGDCPKTPDSKFGRQTVHGSFYGFNWDDDSRPIRVADNRLGLAKVEYRTNFFFSLISVASLGAYAPVYMDYWIEAPKTIERLPKKSGKDQE